MHGTPLFYPKTVNAVLEYHRVNGPHCSSDGSGGNIQAGTYKETYS
jgi:hypothetical protein